MKECKGLVLLIEDNEELNIANSRALGLRGYEVVAALTLAEAEQKLAQTQPDIILLDVMLPDGDGFAFCEKIRADTRAHILFLTAKTEHEDMVRGLSGGGDDYIAKPFHPAELLARIDAAMRRRKMDKTPAKRMNKGTLSLDVKAAQAFIGGSDLTLTPKEFSLLLLLVEHEGSIVTAHTIYQTLWNAPLGDNKNALQAIISKLRQKIKFAGYGIRTERGKGYSFVAE